MQSVISFFKSRQFFIQLAIIIGLISVSLFVTHKWLSSYTRHGEYVKVPDFTGLKTNELDNYIKDKYVSYEIIDSIYYPGEKSGIVLRQDPDSGAKVKHNRTVYLYVTSMVPPQIKMPKLVDRSERQAKLVLETYGLKLGRITEQQADCNGCIISQSIKGREIEPGKMVKKGSVVDLIVGRKDNLNLNSKSDTTAQSDDKIDFDKGED